MNHSIKYLHTNIYKLRLREFIQTELLVGIYIRVKFKHFTKITINMGGAVRYE